MGLDARQKNAGHEDARQKDGGHEDSGKTDAGQNSYRTGGMKYRTASVQVRCRRVWIQDSMDAGQDGCRIGQKQDISEQVRTDVL